LEFPYTTEMHDAYTAVNVLLHQTSPGRVSFTESETLVLARTAMDDLMTRLDEVLGELTDPDAKPVPVATPLLVDDLHFETVGTVNVRAALHQAGIRTVHDLAMKTDHDLLQLKGLGDTAVAMIRRTLARLDYQPPPSSILDVSFGVEPKLDTRIQNILYNFGIHSIGDFMAMTDLDLHRLRRRRGVGQKSFEAILAAHARLAGRESA
jgi:DNA-directed RNA polymerase alpha subunit